MIVLETDLKPEDYDKALLQPARATKWLLLSLQVFVAAAVFGMVLPSMAHLFSKLAELFSDPAKWASFRGSGVAYWALPTLAVLVPFSLWFLWLVLRMTLAHAALALRPRDLRELRNGVYTGPMRFVFAPTGVRVEMRDARRFLSWSAFSEAVEAPDRVRLVFRRQDGGATSAGIFVPARLFADGDERREFVRVANLFIREPRA
jgi:hypothetical protein